MDRRGSVQNHDGGVRRLPRPGIRFSDRSLMTDRLANPLNDIAAAMHHAALIALPDVRYEIRDAEATRGWSREQLQAAQAKENAGEKAFPRKTVSRRPQAAQCHIAAMFPQLWGSTSLGFGGVGGAACTGAYTCVVAGPEQHLAVYFGGRFAYLLDPQTQNDEQKFAWEQDLSKFRAASRKEAVTRYGAQLEPAHSLEQVA